MPSSMPIQTPNRILFIRPSALGDVCRSVPVISSLRAAFPEATIDWLVQSEFTDAIAAHPAISQVIPFPRNVLRKWYTPTGIKHFFALCKLLKQNKYELVIDGQGLGRSGFLTWMTGAPRRIGPSNAREYGWLGYTDRVEVTSKHTVDNMLELVERLGVQRVQDMQLYAKEEDNSWWEEFSGKHDIGNYVVLAPTSRWKSKQWPVERFLEVARKFQERGYKVVVVGAPSELQQVEPLVQLEGVLNLLPFMQVGRLLSVIENATLVVANDSAALHIAIGFNKPCVALYGPTNPAVAGPYQRMDCVVAAPVQYARVHYRDASLGDSIMQEISLDSVLEKIEQLITELQS